MGGRRRRIDYNLADPREDIGRRTTPKGGRILKDCHSCEHAREIESGKYASTPWRKTPCAKCLQERRAPACRSCRTRKDIDAGKLIGIPFEDTPCARCLEWYRHDPTSNHGRTHVQIDADESSLHDENTVAGRDLAGPGEHPIFADQDPDEPNVNFRTDPSIAAMSYLAKAILGLSPTTREVVLDRLAYPERPIVRIAERLKMPSSTIHDHLKRARKSWPALAYAVPMASWTKKRPAAAEESD